MNISGLSKAAVLAVLYNRSRPQGMGFKRYDERPMSEEDAQRLIDRGLLKFDYLQGRVMKIDLEDDEVETWLYNRDNGENAAEEAVATLRSTGEVNTDEIRSAQDASMLESARETEKALEEGTTYEGVINTGPLKGFTVVRAGMAHRKKELQPEIDRATKGRHRRNT